MSPVVQMLRYPLQDGAPRILVLCADGTMWVTCNLGYSWDQVGSPPSVAQTTAQSKPEGA